MTTATSLNDHTALEGILRCHQIRPIRYSRACAVEDNALYCGSSHPSSSRFSSKDGVRRERGRCEQLSISRAHYVIFGWTRFGTSSVNKSRPDKLGWSIIDSHNSFMMPSLADSLAQLSLQSAQIQHLSTLNSRPAGPFVQAYLHLPTSSSSKSGTVLNLIRDAQDSEVRLFKYIGETEGSGEKRVEKRDGVVVTPLREMRGKGKVKEGRDEVDVMLRTALKLVDD
jgi:hypothetical protein